MERPERVEVEWWDATEWRGDLSTMQPTPAYRKGFGLLTHKTDGVIVIVHDQGEDGNDAYASIIPLRNVIRCTPLVPKEDS